MRKLNRFEISIILIALVLVGAGIWGMGYNGFSGGDSVTTEAIGEISEFKQVGEIKRHHKDSFAWQQLDQTAKVYERDTVYVGAGSTLSVHLVDDTIVSIASDSLVVFEKSKMLQGGQTGVFLVKGEMAVEGKNVAVSLTDDKKVVTTTRSKFSIVKRNKKATVVVESGDENAVTYVEKEKVMKKLEVKPRAPVEVASYEATQETEKPIEAPEHEAAKSTPAQRHVASDAASLPVSSAVPPVVDPVPAAPAPPEATEPAVNAQALPATPDPAPTPIENPTPDVPTAKAPPAAAHPEEVVENDPFASDDKEEETKANVTADITPVFPLADAVVDLTEKFPALSFRFRVKDPTLKNLTLQFASDEEFQHVVFQSRVNAAEKVTDGTNSRGPKFQTKLSGVYLVLNEPVVSLAYSHEHRLFWRVTAGGGEQTSLASAPRPLNFQVNPKVEVVSRVGAVTRKQKSGARAAANAILWNVKGRIPTRYRVSFYSDAKYHNKICSDSIRASAIPMNLSGSTGRLENAELSASEEFVPMTSTLCHSATAEIRAPASQHDHKPPAYFYRIEPLSATGTPMVLLDGSQTRGEFRFPSTH